MVVPTYVIFDPWYQGVICYLVGAVILGLAGAKLVEVATRLLPRRYTCVRLDDEGVSFGRTFSPPAFTETLEWGAIDALTLESDGIALQAGRRKVWLPVILFPEDRKALRDVLTYTKPSLLRS